MKSTLLVPSLRTLLRLMLAALFVGLPRVLHATPLPEGLIYASPVPSARLVHGETSLLLRFARPVPESGIRGLISVRGSVSGPHQGALARLEGGALVRFTPDRPFTTGETVAVSVIVPGSPDPAPATYTFEIARSRPAPPVSAIEEALGTPAPIAAPAGISSDTLPLVYPEIVASVNGATAPGSIFVSTLSFSQAAPGYLLILKNDGQPLFYREMPHACFDFKPQPNGQLTYYDSDRGLYVVLDSSYTIVRTIQCGNDYTADLHELRLLANDHALLMSYDPEFVDMSQVVPGGNPQAMVTGLVIQELDASGNVVFQWRSWDHFQITDATHEDLTAPIIDYVHGNALEVDADGNLLLSSRHMDEISKIDRITGEIVWRWGGLHNQFTLLDDSVWFSHQHAIRRLPNGHITMFDNGNYHVPQFSRGVEYVLDEAQKTARVVWQFRATPDIVAGAMGYVERLSNGNTLIGWGTGKPDVLEVQPDGQVVMSLRFADDNLHSYRAFRDLWNHSAAVTPSAPPTVQSLSPNRPNPFSTSTELLVRVPERGIVTLKVYDLMGREVASLLDHAPREPGIYRARVDLTGRRSGVYFCRLDIGSHSSTRAIVLAR